MADFKHAPQPTDDHHVSSLKHVNRTHAQHASRKPLHFKEGGLHASTGTPAGEKIPASRHAAAASGKLGPKAKKQESFFRNVLHGGKK